MRPISATRETPSFSRIEPIALPCRRFGDRRDHVRRPRRSLMTLLAPLRHCAPGHGVRRRPQDRLLSRPAVMRLAARELAAAQRDAAAGLDRITGEPRRQRLAHRRGRRSRPTRDAASRRPHCGAGPGPIRGHVPRSRQAHRGLVIGDRRGRRASLSRLPQDAPAQRRQLLEDLQSTLSTLSAVQYGRPEADRGGIDAAVTKAIEIARQVRSEHSWPREWLRRLTHAELPSRKRRRDWPQPHPHADRPGDCRVADAAARRAAVLAPDRGAAGAAGAREPDARAARRARDDARLARPHGLVLPALLRTHARVTPGRACGTRRSRCSCSACRSSSLALADPYTALVSREESFPGRRIGAADRRVDQHADAVHAPASLNKRAATDAAFFTTVAAAERFVQLRMKGQLARPARRSSSSATRPTSSRRSRATTTTSC